MDFDGTLAVYGIPGRNGTPIAPMVERVKQWLADGREVRIVTAQVACSGARNKDGVLDGEAYANEKRAEIQLWCATHIGHVLPVTASKDYGMVELWDDRAVQIVPNTGDPVALLFAGRAVAASAELKHTLARQDSGRDMHEAITRAIALLDGPTT